MANATSEAPKNIGKPAVSNNGETRQFDPRHELAFWKPNQSKKGTAALFQFQPKKGDKEASFWLNMVPESGNDNGPKFNQDGKLVAKLGMTDIGELLACLSGRNGGLGRQKDGKWSGLYHQNASGNTVIKLDPNESNQGHYYLSVSVKKEGGNEGRLSISLTPSDQELLMVFFRTYLPQMFLS